MPAHLTALRKGSNDTTPWQASGNRRRTSREKWLLVGLKVGEEAQRILPSPCHRTAAGALHLQGREGRCKGRRRRARGTREAASWRGALASFRSEHASAGARTRLEASTRKTGTQRGEVRAAGWTLGHDPLQWDEEEGGTARYSEGESQDLTAAGRRRGATSRCGGRRRGAWHDPWAPPLAASTTLSPRVGPALYQTRSLFLFLQWNA